MELEQTLNSDDPAYFGGYLEENYTIVADTFKLTHQELAQLAKNSIQASFCSDQRKEQLLAELDEAVVMAASVREE